jgi:hypothetical protein
VPPILVTGSHRSGTGWVGQVLAASPRGLGYVWEPFSILHRPGTCAARFEHWFPYVCAENEDGVRGPVADMLEWRYATGAELSALRSPRDAARMVRDASRYARNRRRRAVPLLKDPIAVFSVEWLHEAFSVEPVLLVRHPAAFAASVKRLRLRHPFGHFLAQPLMMRDWLGPFTPDLSRRPVEGFHALFDLLGLPRDAQVDRMILDTSDASNPAEAGTADSIRRDSASHVWNWKRTLEEGEIARVHEGTAALAARFYGPDDW